MAVTFTGAGTAVAASGAAPQSVTTATSFAVGDILVVLMAYDNSGGGGSDPMSGQISLAPSTGAVGASVSAQTGHNDPGAASAGLAARCVAFPVTTAIPSGNGVSVNWSGTVVVRAVAFMKVSSAGITGYRTNSGATGTNGVAVTTRQLVTPSVNSGEGVLCWAGHENGAAITGDADTTNGTWSAVYGTFTGSGVAGMAAYFQSKVVTATATQTWDPTGTSSDWIVGALIFTETLVPAITQAAYQWFDEGTESGAVAYAAQDTAVVGNITNGDATGTLRIRLQSTTAVAVPATDDWQLQYEKNTSGTWINVTAVTTNVSTYDSPNLTNAAATTNRLTGGTGSFVAGKVSEDSLMDDLGWAGNNFTELVYALKVKAADVAAADTLRFRVLRNGATTTMTYSVTPTINIVQFFNYNETGRSVVITATVTLPVDQADLEEPNLPVAATATITLPTETFTHITPPPPLIQEGFRWRNDDGSETAATWKAAQDTNVTLETGQSGRLRVLLDTTEVPDPSVYKLHYKKSTDSTWLPVPTTATGPVYVAPSTNIAASGEDTTALLIAPAGKAASDFATGRMWDDENAIDVIEIEGGFVPTALLGLVGWWDASDDASFTYSSGAAVSQWNDKSVNNYHLSQATVGLQPSRSGVQNGRPTVVFNGGNNLERSSGVTFYTASASVFVAVKETTEVADSGIFAAWYAGGGHSDWDSHSALGLTTGSASNWATAIRWYQAASAPGTGAAPWAIYSALYMPDGVVKIYRDGILVGITPTGPTGFGTTCTGFLLGARYLANVISNRLNGEIAEVLLYSSPLSDGDRSTVEEYLRNKWAIEFDPMALPWAHAWWAEGKKLHDLALTDGAPMGAWPDEVGVATMVQNTSALQPLYRTPVARLNNKPGILPDGVNDYFTLTPKALGNNWSAVVICAPADAWATYTMFLQITGGTPAFNIPGSNHVASGGGTGQSSVPYWGNYNARLFVMHYNYPSVFMSVDDIPAYYAPSGLYGDLKAIPSVVFIYNDFASRQVRDPVAFIGIAAGDIRTHPGWSDFARWAKEYYDVPLIASSPTEIEGLRAWFDASDAASITSSDSLVSQWSDKSGNNLHVTQATGTAQPTLGPLMKGRSAVRFDGVNDQLTGPVSQLVNATDGTWTVFTVQRAFALRTQNIFDQDNGSSTRIAQFMGQESSQARAIAFNTAVGSTVDYGGAASATVPQVFAATRRATNIEAVAVNVANPVPTNTTGTPQNGTLAFRIGAHMSNNYYFGGDIAEIVLYDRVLTPAERTSVEQYLTNKWIPNYVEDRTVSVTSAFYLTLDRLNGVNGAVWTPRNLAGLLAWYDATVASSFSYSTGNDPGDPGSTYVSQWRDLSGQANHADGNANAGYHPKRNVTINGLPAVDLSTGYIAQLKSLTITTLPGTETQPSTYFAVVQTPSTLQASGMIFGHVAQGVSFRNNASGQLEMTMTGVGQIAISPAGTVEASTTYLLSCSYTSAGQSQIRKNGLSVMTAATNRIPISATALNLGGTNNQASNPFGGVIAEAIIYADALPPPALEIVESYLAAKWGLTLFGGPTTIAGLSLWLDASDTATITESGGLVSQWNDKSGNNRHVTASGTNRPATGQSSFGTRNALLFDGVDDYFTGPAAQLANATTGEWTFFAVVKFTSGGAVTKYIASQDINTAGNRIAHFYVTSSDNTQSYGWNTAGASFQDGGGKINTALPTVVSSVRTTTSVEAFVNGVGATGSTATTGTPSTGAPLFRIGATGTGSPTPWLGEIAEVIIYNTALSATDRANVEGWLRAKWGPS